MATIYLVRHCESEGNAARRAHAQTDSLVTLKGYAQAKVLAERFEEEKIDAVYASDSFRAIQTVAPIAERHNAPLRVRIGFRELTTGIWEDESWGNIAAEYPELCRIWMDMPWKLATPGATTFNQTADRVIYGIKRAAREIGPDGTAVISSHSCAIKSSLCKILGLPMEEVLTLGHGENTSVSKLTVDSDGNISAEYINDESHLPEHLRRPWSGLAGQSINMAEYTVDGNDRERVSVLMSLKEQAAKEAGRTFELHEELNKFEACGKHGFTAIGILNNRYCGYLTCGLNSEHPNDGTVTELYVDKSLGAGFGEQLLGHAIHELRYRGCDNILIAKDADGELRKMTERFAFSDCAYDSALSSLFLYSPLNNYRALG